MDKINDDNTKNEKRREISSQMRRKKPKVDNSVSILSSSFDDPVNRCQGHNCHGLQQEQVEELSTRINFLETWSREREQKLECCQQEIIRHRKNKIEIKEKNLEKKMHYIRQIRELEDKNNKLRKALLMVQRQDVETEEISLAIETRSRTNVSKQMFASIGASCRKLNDAGAQ